uniref:Palmitoyltransferase n=1 Tax=Meloidogyne incognita TaxID=6306 RepID=A0A914L4Y0_MELIC
MRKCFGSRLIKGFISIIRWVPVVFVLLIICWAWYTYIIEFCFKILDDVIIRIIYLLIVHLLLLMFLWSYIKTVISTIGKPSELFHIPIEVREYIAAATNDHEFRSILEEFVKERNIPLLTRGYDGGIRFCLKCSCVKPDRAHHCSVCGHCVLKFDHHCPWVNTCINYRNYKFFIQFLGYGFLMCAFVFFTILPHFINFWSKDDPMKVSFLRITVFFLFFVTGMFAISLGCLFGYHLFLTGKNRSTVESFRPPVFAYGADRNGFNLGVKSNFADIFGSEKFKWFLPIFTSTGNGQYFPQKPTRGNQSHQYQGNNYQTGRALQAVEVV